MAYWKHYHTPKTVHEALHLLDRYNGEARIIGGGTDLLLEIQQGHRPPVEALIDPTQIEGLNRIYEEDGYLVVGAGVTHTQIVHDERMRKQATCMVESCGVIGGPQVRNVATLTGNIAHALPAGDGTIGLLALNGELEISSSIDERDQSQHLAGHRALHAGISWVPMEQTFLGPGKSTVDPTLMFISRVRFRPTGEDEASAFRRVMRPQGVALPMISMAARLKLNEGNIAKARITIGPSGIVPFVAHETAAFLIGKPATEETFVKAAEIANGEARFRSSKHRASAEYRKEMLSVQIVKTLAKAADRARTGVAEPEGVGE